MSRKLRWILLTALIFFIAISCDRFFLLFTSGHLDGIKDNLLKTFWLGARYDLREVGILFVVMQVLSAIPLLDPFRHTFGKRFWLWLLSVLSVFVVLVYVVDTMHFDYLAQRLNASILNFIPEGSTSVLMVWQTYPVVRLLLLIASISALLIFFIRKVFRAQNAKANEVGKKGLIISNILFFLLAAICIFGRVDQYPLRWSDAFGLGDSRLSQLALNPFQSFFSSLHFRKVTYDRQTPEKYKQLIHDYYEVSDSAGDRVFVRKVQGSGDKRPNVVLVICESFSMYKSSMCDNPLNTTPYFKTLCDNGIFFDRCFTPHFGTARGVWATVTGIPDILLEKTASRDPLIVDQHSIINDFTGYEKDYFIGGSTSWANIKGVLEENIIGVTIHEQGSYNAKRVDVWGISDKNLFIQANAALREKKGPFFTVIQTSDNHRPYTIPKEDEQEFKKVSVSRDSLVKYGFQSNEELNAFRYTDFCFMKFMEAAKKEAYFNNTIFVFVGDHGIRGNAADMLPKAWTSNALTCYHVPLLIYAPGLLQPSRHTMICSQVDVLPTIAGITGIPYTNTTMGRDLLHLSDTTSNVAFVMDHDIRTIAVVKGDYVLQRQLANNTEVLASVKNNDVIPKDKEQEIIKEMQPVVTGFYEISRYLLFNNRKHR